MCVGAIKSMNSLAEDTKYVYILFRVITEAHL